MNAVQTRRLLKLADFLQVLPRQKFDFAQIVEQGGAPMMEALKAGPRNCGTVACAIGWMPAVFPRQIAWEMPEGSTDPRGVCDRKDASLSDFHLAAEFFGISYGEASWLFSPFGSWGQFEDSGSHRLGYKATPKQVAQHIRRFIAKKSRSDNHEKVAVRQD